MKKLLLLPLLVLVAATFIDQVDGDFLGGTPTNINITNNSLILDGSPGNYTLTGLFESQIFNLGGNPKNITIGWNFTAPTGTSVIIQTRSGPTTTPDGNWTAYSAAYTNSTESNITNQQNRYYQYRINLTTTNASVTPVLDLVIITYVPSGPDVVFYSTITSDLTEDTTGPFRFYVNITSLVNIAPYEFAYAIGSDNFSAYTSATNSTVADETFEVDIPEPTLNWSSREGEILYIRFNVTDAAATTNITFGELIDSVNDVPILDPLSNITGTESVALTYQVSAVDPDGDSLTFNTTQGVVGTVINNTNNRQSVNITWTPEDPYTGLVTVTVMAIDGNNTSDVGTFTANITSTNDPPIMSAITDQEVYFGDLVTFDITVTDVDLAEIMTYRTVPDLFDVTPGNITGDGTYTGHVNFTALTDHEGVNLISVYVNDGTFEDHQNFTLTVRYCGDDVCQTADNESELTCTEDCGPVYGPSYVAFDIPGRICANESFNISAYNASSRFVCDFENRAYESAAYCEVLEGATITIYSIETALHTEVFSGTTSADGIVSYTPATEGIYKIIGEMDNHLTATQTITVQNCLPPIDSESVVIKATRPDLSVEDTLEQEIVPRIETPEATEEEVSLLSILIWYLIVPLLLASMVYVSSLYYQLNRDTNPAILAVRIKLFELSEKLEPVLGPLREAFAPIGALFAKIFAPISNLLARFGKR